MEFMNKLFNFGNNKTMECSVCLSNVNENDCCKISCGHIFHTSCIVGCNNKCPLCRKVINTNIVSNDNIDNTNNTVYIDYIDDDNDEYDLEKTLKTLLQKSKNVDVSTLKIIQKFIREFTSERYLNACKIMCIYKFGSLMYFRKMGLVELESCDYDILNEMSNAVKYFLSDVQIDAIEDNVLKLMPSMPEFQSFDDGVDRSYILNLKL
jgi:hypothetical protein